MADRIHVPIGGDVELAALAGVPDSPRVHVPIGADVELEEFIGGDTGDARVHIPVGSDVELQRLVDESAGGGGGGFSTSDDGSWISFVVREQPAVPPDADVSIWLMPADGSGTPLRVVHGHNAGPDDNPLVDPRNQFLYDAGSHLVMSMWAMDLSESFQAYQTAIVDPVAADAAPTWLTTNTTYPQGLLAFGFNAAGRLVLTGDSSEIWTMESDGSDPQMLYKGTTEEENAGQYVFTPAWSADGESIFFTIAIDGTDLTVAKMNADGSGLDRTFSGRVCGGDMVVKPDTGELFVWLDNNAYFIDPDTAAERTLTITDIVDSSPVSFSPSGAKVVYQARSEHRLYVADSDFTDPVALDTSFADATGTWERWMPNWAPARLA